MTLKFGGHFSYNANNIQNSNSFEFLLHAPASKLFGKKQYPNIFQKAAVYAFFIIKDHVFYDGNKRTGMEAMFLFLELNGYLPNIEFSEDVIVDIALKIESGELDIQSLSSIMPNYFISNA